MKFKKSLLSRAVGLGALGLSSAVASASVEDVNVDFSGFSSVVFGQTLTNKDQGEVFNIPTQLDLNKFNILGLRIDADLKQKLNFTTQFIAYGSSNYEPKIDWLNVSYNFTPDITLTAGRSRIPFYFYSDVLDVGYAYPWITPPQSVYTTEAVRSVDGLSFRWAAEMTDTWTSDWSIWAGNSEQELVEQGGANYTVKDMIGTSWSVNHNWLTLRAVYAIGNSTIDLPAQAQGWDLLSGLPGSTFATVRDEFELKNNQTIWRGVGVMMEFDGHFIVSEYNQLHFEDTAIVPEENSVYATYGVQLPANVMLSFTYSYDENKLDAQEAIGLYNNAIANIDYSFLPAEAQAPTQAGVAAITGGLQGALATTIYTQNTFNITTRWDFHPQADFKVEYQYQERNLTTGVLRPQSLRAAIDVIF